LVDLSLPKAMVVFVDRKTHRYKYFTVFPAAHERWTCRVQIPDCKVDRRKTYDTKDAAVAFGRSVREQYRRTGTEVTLSPSEAMEYRDAKEKVGDVDLRLVADYWLRRHPDESRTVAEALELYRTERRAKGTWNKVTLAEKKGKLEWLEDSLGEFDLRDIELEHLERLINGLPHNPTTISNHVRFLKAFWNWCVKPKGWIKHSPALYLEHRKTKQAPVSYLPVSDARKFLEAAETHDPALVPLLVLSLFAGIRPSAAVRMAPFADELIDLEEKSIVIPGVHRGVEINKTEGYRIEKSCPDAIWHWLGAYWDGGAIDVCNHEGRRQRIVEHAGIEWVHDAMRHTFATYAFKLEDNIAKVAAWLGHTDSRLTKRHYANAIARQKHAREYFAMRPKEGAKPVVRRKTDPHAPKANWPSDAEFVAWCEREPKTHIAAILGVSEARVRARLKRIIENAEQDASA